MIEGAARLPGETYKALESFGASWETIPPKSVKECLGQTGGEVNTYFVRCRAGYQELASYRGKQRIVHSERAIPERRY